MKYPSNEELQSIFILDPTSPSGLCWKIKPRRGIQIGDHAGTCVNGYLQVQLNRKHYYSHRIVWIMTHGGIDESKQIDHIDMNKGNNLVSNLREASSGNNQINMNAKSNSRTGIRGLSIRTFPKRNNGYFMYCVNVTDSEGISHSKTIHPKQGLSYVLDYIVEMRKKFHGEFYREDIIGIEEVRINIKNNYGFEV